MLVLLVFAISQSICKFEHFQSTGIIQIKNKIYHDHLDSISLMLYCNNDDHYSLMPLSFLTNNQFFLVYDPVTLSRFDIPLTFFLWAYKKNLLFHNSVNCFIYSGLTDQIAQKACKKIKIQGFK